VFRTILVANRTILDAVTDVLADAEQPLGVKEIHSRIEARRLYEFKAKNPIDVVRSAIRSHLVAVQAGKSTARLRAVGADAYAVVR